MSKTAHEMLNDEGPFDVFTRTTIEKLMNAYADQRVSEALNSQWVSADEPPKAKEGWTHTERVLLWYKGTENFCESYGIGYYHYSPPFDDPKWIDFHYAKSRQPDAWQKLPSPPLNH